MVAVYTYGKKCGLFSLDAELFNVFKRDIGVFGVVGLDIHELHIHELHIHELYPHTSTVCSFDNIAVDTHTPHTHTHTHTHTRYTQVDMLIYASYTNTQAAHNIQIHACRYMYSYHHHIRTRRPKP